MQSQFSKHVPADFAQHTVRILKAKEEEDSYKKTDNLTKGLQMQWKYITDANQINDIKKQEGYSLIFKHSTRCSVSMMAKRRFEMDWEAIPENTSLYFLDLIAYRPLSAQIAETFQVQHESPQILLIKDGDCILDASHSDISAEEVAEVVSQ